MTTTAATPQPDPRKGRAIVLTYVLEDVMARAAMGKVKYGTLLEARNGRDALMDAYQEAIDLVMYLRQALLEREGV